MRVPEVPGRSRIEASLALEVLVGFLFLACLALPPARLLVEQAQYTAHALVLLGLGLDAYGPGASRRRASALARVAVLLALALTTLLGAWGSGLGPTLLAAAGTLVTGGLFLRVMGAPDSPVLRLGSHTSKASVTALLILGLGLGLFAGWTASSPERHEHWISPAPLWPPYADLGVVLSGIEAERQGLDPYLSNPSDPWGRVFNYPRCWLALGVFGIDTRSLAWLGTVGVLLFLASYGAFFREASQGEVLVAAVALTSPYSLLGIERGNIDLAIFAVLAAALAARGRLMARSSQEKTLGLALLGASVLKLFPCFAFLALLPERARKGRWLRLALLVLAFGIYVAWLAARGDLAKIGAGTPRGFWGSYGSRVLALQLAHDGFLAPELVDLCSRFLLGLVGGSVLATVLRGGFRVRALVLDEDRGAAFVAGAAIFCGSFLLGNSFGYRLIFLALAFPQTMRWAQRPESRAWGVGLTAVALAQLCGYSHRPGRVYIFHALSWLVFWAFSVVLGSILGRRLTAGASRYETSLTPA